MNGGIIVKFSDYENCAKKYKSYLKQYKEWLTDYTDYINNICEEAITSGKVHDSLIKFNIELSKVLDTPTEIANSVDKILNTYLDELDEAQKINGVSILYDRDYKDYRDYSGAFFLRLEKMSEDADYDSGFFNSFFDSIEDAYYGIGKFFGKYDNSKKEKIKETQDALLQYNDVTRRQVRNIKRRVGDADDKCHDRLELVSECIDRLQEYIGVFKETMFQFQYMPKKFSVLGVDFATKYNLVVSSLNDVLILDTITDEDVEAFINSEASEEYMDEQVQIVNNYIADLSQLEISDYDFWKIVIFQMFDIAEGQISSGGEYEKLVMKKELTEMLDGLAENYVYSDSNEQEAVDAVNSLFKEAEKAGKNIYDYLNSLRDSNGKLVLDGRTKPAKEFMSFLDSLENAQDILKYGDQAIEIFTKLFIDYEKNLAFLDSFEKNANLSEEMMECFKELRATYEHELNQTFIDVVRQVGENGVDALYSVSVGKMVGTVKKAIGLIGDLTGESARTAAQLEVLNYGYDIVNSSQDAFIESMKKLKAADKDAENYEELMTDFKNCFSIYKSSLKRIFEKMAIASEGSQRDYFYYCSSEISSMTLKDFENPDFMSYEEYLKDGYAY